MGKTTGFIEYERGLPILRSPAERIGNWDEFHTPLPEDELIKQGARCMNCGTPFCHTGITIDAVTTGCPLNNLIPEWNDLVYRGKHQEAYRRLAVTNNFPEFTGRVCPAPCESSCVLAINNDPVMIKEIELSIIDRGFEEGWVSASKPPTRTGKSVAVIGSGPAGLACADELNKHGHSVTVFERDDRIGGLLMYGIPNMKLNKDVVERRVNLLREEGIDFRTSAAVGSEIPVEQLRNDFDATVLCMGSPKPRDLDIESRQLNDIHFAMDLLRENTRRILDKQEIDVFRIKGKRVVVIGGGDTGTDCVATSLRLGCQSLMQFEILDRPTTRTATHDGWLAKARNFQTDYGQEESIEIFGSDPREYSILTKRFIGNQSGNVAGIETVSVSWKNGRPVEIAGSERIWPADVVLLAMGFVGAEKGTFLNDLGIEMTDRNNIRVDEHKQTSVPGIFAAGDCERGQSLVVWAIADGRKAAEGVNNYLRS